MNSELGAWEYKTIMATKTKNKILFPFMLLALICLCYLFPCSFFTSMLDNSTDRFGNGTEGRMGGDIYSMNSKTILKGIENGEANIFTLQPEISEEEQIASPVQWSQADFIKVFTAFKQASLGITDIDQKISSMSFTVDDCKNVNLGPQSAHIFTYRLKSGIFVWPPFKMVSYSYLINPLYNEVSWRAEWYDQYVLDALKSNAVLDLANIKISAEEALRIAELNGGKDARLSAQNQCAIDIEINANSDNGNWVVTYGSLLSIEIDKTNGSHIVRASGQRGIYGFDSQTILDSLKSGNKVVFTQLSLLQTDKPISQPVHWTQDDYFHVADAFMEMAWQERLNEWKLASLRFETRCDYASLGPQQISLSIFRQSIPDKYYYEGRIEIKPGQNILTWTRHEDYNPRYALFSEREQNSYNWSQIKISANQALQIVEEQGGKNVSLKLKQDCEISGSLNRNGYFAQGRPQWQINYEWVPSQSSGLIMSFVDIETGAYKIFNYYENKP